MSHFRNQPVAPGIALITGGARGLGNAIAVSFTKERAKGIALVDIQNEFTFSEGKANVEKYGAKMKLYQSANTVKVKDQVERAVKETVDTFGRIDYATNFAGIVGPLDMTWDTNLADWREVIEINTIGLFRRNKHELKQMLK